MSYVMEHSDEAKRLEWQARLGHYLLEDEMKFLNVRDNAKVLDAGCGTGLVSRYIYQMNPKLNSIQGIDFSDIRVQQAKKLSGGNSKISFSNGNLEKLGFADDTFDLCVSRYVYEHVPDTQLVSDELYRLTKKGGKVYIIDFDGIFSNLYTTNKWLNESLSKFTASVNFDLFVGRKIPALLANSGFKNIEWKMSSHAFQGKDLQDEYENTQQRLHFALPVIEQILGGADVAQKFCEAYLTEMQKPESTLFHNKFIVWGEK